jgi:hypothetical protein
MPESKDFKKYKTSNKKNNYKKKKKQNLKPSKELNFTKIKIKNS